MVAVGVLKVARVVATVVATAVTVAVVVTEAAAVAAHEVTMPMMTEVATTPNLAAT